MATTGHENEAINVQGLKASLQKFKTDKVDGKSDKTATVSNVAYDGTNKKITKTINGTTSDVVSVATLKTDLELGQAASRDVDTTATSGSNNLITSGAVYTLCAGIETALEAI